MSSSNEIKPNLGPEKDEANMNLATEQRETKKYQYEDMTTKEAYFASLDAWVKQANISQSAMALFPYYLFSSYPQIFQNRSIAGGLSSAVTPPVPQPSVMGVAAQQTAPGANGIRAVGTAAGAGFVNLAGERVNSMVVLSEQMQADFINRNGGYEHNIAPFWKRAVAELVDVFILLILKLVITFTIMNVFDLDLGFEFDKEVLRKTLEDDYVSFLAISTDFLAFSSDLLVLEIVTKIIVCIYEALWTRQSGATPGKMLLGVRIVYMEAMLPLQPPVPPQLGFRSQRIQLKALLYPAETPSFKRALMRAIAKNILITLLFPMCFIMIFFKNNRTAYDIMTKTIVIEDNPNGILRRR